MKVTSVRVINRIHKCCVDGCLSHLLTPKPALFRFPKELERSRQWAVNCNFPGRKGDALLASPLFNTSYRVCALHFEENMFMNSEKTRLQLDAIPTLNLPLCPNKIEVCDDDDDDDDDDSSEESEVEEIEKTKIPIVLLDKLKEGVVQAALAGCTIRLKGIVPKSAVGKIINTSQKKPPQPKPQSVNPAKPYTTPQPAKRPLLPKPTILKPKVTKIDPCPPKVHVIMKPTEPPIVKPSVAAVPSNIHLIVTPISTINPNLVKTGNQTNVPATQTSNISLKNVNKIIDTIMTAPVTQNVPVVVPISTTNSNLVKTGNQTSVAKPQAPNKPTMPVSQNVPFVPSSEPMVTDVVESQPLDTLSYGNFQAKRKCAVASCWDMKFKRHRFPLHNMQLFNFWRVLTGDMSLERMPKNKIYNSKAICSKHFQYHEYEKNETLKPNVIPSIDLPANNYLFGEDNKTCNYSTCTNNRHRAPENTYYFRIPDNKQFQWRLGAGLVNNSTPNQDLFICSQHFNQSDFYDHCPKFLKKTANVKIASSTARPTRCGISTCTNNTNHTPQVYPYPDNKEMTNIWIRNTGNSDTAFGVCYLHFEPRMFKESIKGALREDAFPTLQLDTRLVQEPIIDYNISISNKQTMVCTYIVCGSTQLTPNTRLFMFPQDATLWSEWCRAAGKGKQFEATRRPHFMSFAVCSKHFKDSDFYSDSKRLLHKKAIPIPCGSIEDVSIPSSSNSRATENVLSDVEILENPVSVIDLESEEELSDLEWMDGTPDPDSTEPTCTLFDGSVDFHGFQKKVKAKPVKGNLTYHRLKYYTMQKGLDVGYEVLKGHKVGSKGMKLKYHTAIIIDDDDEQEKALVADLSKHFRSDPPAK
ncbi:uncharacterized protein LOC109599681 [Aethina tumida]|uniref:uncharacterized protein LOC109599681 n=1 Tax=Aethina tumida TaxID=116153 RepID=UPI00214766F2|nr:uncharacterized protein LOC109599681 [Aethina tumida]